MSFFLLIHLVFVAPFLKSRAMLQNGRTALHLAVRHNHEDVVDRLLQDGRTTLGLQDNVCDLFRR